MVLQEGVELFALAAVDDAGVEPCLRQPNTAPGDALPTMIQRRAGNVREAESHSANHLIGAYAAGVDPDFGQHRRAEAEHSGNRHGAQSCSPTFDQERRRFAIRMRSNQHQRRDLAE